MVNLLGPILFIPVVVWLGCLWAGGGNAPHIAKVLASVAAGAIVGAIFDTADMALGGMILVMPSFASFILAAAVGVVEGAIIGLVIGYPCVLLYSRFRRKPQDLGRVLPTENVDASSSRTISKSGESLTMRGRRLARTPTGISILLVAAVPLLVAALKLTERSNPLPLIEDISEMKAKIYIRESSSHVEFEVPESCRNDILAGLLPCYVDVELMKPHWAGLTRLHIETKDGKTFDVDVYNLTNHRFGAFSVPPDQQYFRGGNSRKVDFALRKAYSEYEQDPKKRQ